MPKTISRVTAALEKAVSDSVFCGAVFLAKKDKSVLHFSAHGFLDTYSARPVQTSTWFDLASLTKPLATGFLCMYLYEKNKLGLEAPVADYIKVRSKRWCGVTISHLLDHTSGLNPWLPFYELCKEPTQPEIVKAIEKHGFVNLYSPGAYSRYSDLNFILLWMIVGNILKKEPAEILYKEIYKPLGISEMQFASLTLPPKGNTALGEFNPAEMVSSTIKVSDDNTRFFGGTSGHAGLFGTATGIAKAASALLSLWKKPKKNSNIPFSHKTVEIFANHRRGEYGHFALSFDRPSKTGSLAGDLISRKSIGHLGFSGTSFWIDPERDLILILLSNRIYPHRKNDLLRKFRPLINDLIVEEIEKL